MIAKALRTLVGVLAIVALLVVVGAASGVGPGSSDSAEAARGGKDDGGLRWSGSVVDDGGVDDGGLRWSGTIGGGRKFK